MRNQSESNDNELTMTEWVETIPKKYRSDPLWETGAYYRMSMCLYDLSWQDCDHLRRDFRGREIASQLIRSAGGICANLEEAYGRGLGSPDYIRIVRIALGEARETQGWYVRARHLLGEALLQRRLDTINQIISMLVGNLAAHRRNLPTK